MSMKRSALSIAFSVALGMSAGTFIFGAATNDSRKQLVDEVANTAGTGFLAAFLARKLN